MRHQAPNCCDGSLQSTPIGSRGLLLFNIGGVRLEDVFASLEQEPFLVSQAGWQFLEPFQDFDVVITHVVSVAEKARGCQGHDRNHRVHAGDEQGLVPREIGEWRVSRTQMMVVVFR